MVTAIQLGLPSLMPLSVAGYGRLQVGAAYRATSVAVLQIVENLPHKLWLWILHWGLLAIEDFTL